MLYMQGGRGRGKGGRRRGDRARLSHSSHKACGSDSNIEVGRCGDIGVVGKGGGDIDSHSSIKTLLLMPTRSQKSHVEGVC